MERSWPWWLTTNEILKTTKFTPFFNWPRSSFSRIGVPPFSYIVISENVIPQLAAQYISRQQAVPLMPVAFIVMTIRRTKSGAKVNYTVPFDTNVLSWVTVCKRQRMVAELSCSHASRLSWVHCMNRWPIEAGADVERMKMKLCEKTVNAQVSRRYPSAVHCSSQRDYTRSKEKRTSWRTLTQRIILWCRFAEQAADLCA